MKKITLLTSLLLLCITLSAAPRNIQQARLAVSRSANLQYAYTAVQPDGQPAFYVFNKPDGQGFVIVSADDRAYTILGYSDNGSWDENDLPDNLRAWLESYKQDLETIDRLPDYPAVSTSLATYTPVAPLCQTQWNQNAPYNNLCPSWKSGHAAAGCVAIAGSQIMKYHAYPEHGVGSHSYKWANENGDSITLSADFANTTYDWANMRNTYSAPSATQAQKDAVATIIYHCGVACDMVYGSSSSANTSTLAQELINTFAYDKSIRPLYKDYAGDSILMEAIQADLSAGRPVLMRGRTIEDTGHAFVCDGIDADGLLHINWGWGGKSDGYYRLSALAPTSQGTGGSSTNKAYTEQVQIYTGIRPEAGGDYVPHLICEKVSIAQQSLGREDTVKFVIDTLRNRGLSTWSGSLRLYIYQNGELYKTRNNNNFSMKPRTVYYSRSYRCVISYPPGEYEIVMSIRSADDEDAYIPLYCHGVGEWKCSMTITNDSIYLNQVHPNPPQAIETTELNLQPKVQKILRNGVLYFRCEGETYTLQGLKVRD